MTRFALSAPFAVAVSGPAAASESAQAEPLMTIAILIEAKWQKARSYRGPTVQGGLKLASGTARNRALEKLLALKGTCPVALALKR